MPSQFDQGLEMRKSVLGEEYLPEQQILIDLSRNL